MQSPLLNVMTAAAAKAGKGLMRDFGEVDQLQISRKGTANFVTSADLRTEKLLQRELSKARPEFGFLMEEAGEIPGKDGQHRWIIDPLDGTSNFIHAVPYFCITIAVERRGPDGRSEIIAAVTFDPIHNEMFTAEKGKGALLNNRRLQVSGRERMEEAMLATNAPKSTRQTGRFEALIASGITVRCFGATALDLAYLAAGRIDACWYPTGQPWDLAAGILLVQEAGGETYDETGSTASMMSGNLLAANRAFSSPMRKLLSGANASS